MKVSLPRVPHHGMVWVDIPRGSDLLLASDARGPLPCQFIPAPFDHGETGGRLLVQARQRSRTITLMPGHGEAAARPGCDFARVEGHTLYIRAGGTEVPLDASFDNGPVKVCTEGFELIPGQFPFFGPLSEVVTLSRGPLARVARIMTPLADEGSGTVLAATVCYDVVVYETLPLVLVTACFETAEPIKMANCHAALLRLPRAGLTRWYGGRPFMEGDPRENPRFPCYDFEGDRQHERSFNHFCGVQGTMDVGFVGGQPVLFGSEQTLMITSQEPFGEQDAAQYTAQNPLAATLCVGDDAGAWAGQLPVYCHLPTPREDTLVLAAGDLSLSLRVTGQGACLCCLQDEKTGNTWLNAGGCSLFTLLLRQAGGETQYTLRSDRGWERVTAAPAQDQMDLLFTHPADPALAGLSVHLTARCGQDRVSWHMNVINDSETLTLVQAEYPRLSFSAAGALDGYFSYGVGQVVEDIGEMALHHMNEYPSLMGTMAYLAVMDRESGRGLYFAVHDPEGCHKVLRTERCGLTGLGSMGATIYAEGIGEAGNSHTLAGQAVWQLFTGHWYEAAMIYRDWAVNHGSWMPPLGPEGRPDTAPWLKQAPFWVRSDLDDPERDWVADLLAVAQDVGVPILCHAYYWHQIPFDDDYPHFLPAKQAFIDGIAPLQAAGIRVVPYINSRLWDTRDRGDEDWQFTSVALPAAAKNHRGEVYVESYYSEDEQGQPVQLAVMCPATALWQDTQRELTRRLYGELGVDAIHVDQSGAAPKLCMDAGHGHRRGGGSWWNRAYNNLFDHLRQTMPEGGGFTSEGYNEIFINRMDAFLVWQWAQYGQVPAFIAVYAPYIQTFGRSYISHSEGDTTTFRILTGQSFVYGSQMGWLTARQYLEHPCRPYLGKLARLRHGWGEYLWAGAMEKPPEVTGAVPTLVCDNRMSFMGVLTSPAVLASQWRRLRDGARILLITNLSEETVTCEIRPQLPAGANLRLHGDMTGPGALTDGRLALKLPPCAAVVAAIEA